MAMKFKVGDKVKVPQGTEGTQAWWWEKQATVRAVLEESALYEVLFDDAYDFAFIEEHKLAPASQS
jgi:hypothetical protein